MKNIIAYTQRVDIIESYGERRNSSDERWAEFIDFCGLLPLPLVNHPNIAVALVTEMHPSLILLTGGNNLVSYSGDAPERDATETALLDYALQQSIPVLGVCRGMQLLQHYFGGKLEQVKNHTAVFHPIVWNGSPTLVNSYHNLAVLRPAEGFKALACTDDGVVEAFSNQSSRIQGIMWHPEREKEFQTRDRYIVEQLILGGKQK